MQKTRDDPAKFERFAAKVLGNQNSSSGQSLLKAQLAAAIDKRIAYNLRNFPGYNPNEPAPAPAEYARLDAVGAIVNEVCIWATAPYLHNGSVPNLDELLQPSAQRSKSFSIGVRTFDPVRVGYLTDVAGFPKFNVNDSSGKPIAGNSNAGHEGDQYGTNLSPDERRQLIEYLKSL